MAESVATRALFLETPEAMDMTARVVAVHETERGRAVVLDQTVFYAEGGGQPGDAGRLSWNAGAADVAVAVKGPAPGEVWHLLAEGAAPPNIGDEVLGQLDAPRRRAHMRMHTALHLLSVVLPLPVTGGSIGAEKSRLDFDMPDAPGDKAALEAELNALVDGDYPVSSEWITEAELDANPSLVKTMAVKPPRGAGRVRLVRIGEGDQPIDLQPCGGTHVARTGEIGLLRLGKIEKKGKQNRRVSVFFA